MRNFRPIFHSVRRFRRDDAASMSVEAVMVLPFLLWAFLATFVYFDLYRAKSLSLKANYAVSDLLSRESSPVDMNDLLGYEDVFQYLTQGGDPAWLRITEIYCNAECGTPQRELKRQWSKATDGLPIHSNTDIQKKYASIIPVIAEGEYVIMVESMAGYEPPFTSNVTGIGPRQLKDIVMTRPRFGKVDWDNG